MYNMYIFSPVEVYQVYLLLIVMLSQQLYLLL